MNAPFMQLYVGDYLKDTRHLTAEQHGAYLLLLMSMWAHGGELPNDPKKLARLACCTTSRWAKISAEVLEFFDVDGAVITQARLRSELKKALEKSIKRAEAGMRGGRAKSLKSNELTEANASGLLKHSSEPEPERITEGKPSVVHERPKKPSEPVGDFDAFWDRFPLKVSKVAASKAYQSAIRKLDHDAIVRHLDHQIRCGVWDGQFRLHASTWLNQERWNDVVEPRRFAGMAGQPAPGYRGRQDTSFADIAARRQREREQGMAVSRGEGAVSSDGHDWSEGAIPGELARRTGEG